jgi:hypothetical protein
MEERRIGQSISNLSKFSMYFLVRFMAANIKFRPGFSCLGSEIEAFSGSKSAASLLVPACAGQVQSE